VPLDAPLLRGELTAARQAVSFLHAARARPVGAQAGVKLACEGVLLHSQFVNGMGWHARDCRQDARASCIDIQSSAPSADLLVQGPLLLGLTQWPKLPHLLLRPLDGRPFRARPKCLHVCEEALLEGGGGGGVIGRSDPFFELDNAVGVIG
jgi:hypothetical protein